MELMEAYQKKVEAQLREWSTWIDRYKADPGPARPGNPADYRRLVQGVEDSYKIALQRLEELCSAQVEHWELSKQAMERAMIELKKVLDESGAGRAGKFLVLKENSFSMFELSHWKG